MTGVLASTCERLGERDVSTSRVSASVCRGVLRIPIRPTRPTPNNIDTPGHHKSTISASLLQPACNTIVSRIAVAFTRDARPKWHVFRTSRTQPCVSQSHNPYRWERSTASSSLLACFQNLARSREQKTVSPHSLLNPHALDHALLHSPRAPR